MEGCFEYMVCTRCFAYNHELYIENALYGFAMQETSFPVVNVIVDDASTDKTPIIIDSFIKKHCDFDEALSKQEETEFFRLFFARHKCNRNCFFAVVLLSLNHSSSGKSKYPYIAEWQETSKYIAICEGDDYWIDPRKLQKQVDYMESSPKCYFCGTNGLVIWENGEKKPYVFNDIISNHILKPEELIGHWVFPTAGIIFRKEILSERKKSGMKYYGADQTYALLGLSLGDVFAMSDVTCVYRRNSKNSTGSTNKAKKKGHEYITEQHILTYTRFNEYTNGRFSQIINPLLKKLKKKVPVYKAMNKSIVLAFFRNPFVFTLIALKKIMTDYNV